MTAVTVAFFWFPVCRPPFLAPPLLMTTATTTTITATRTMPTTFRIRRSRRARSERGAFLFETPGACLFLLLGS